MWTTYLKSKGLYPGPNFNFTLDPERTELAEDTRVPAPYWVSRDPYEVDPSFKKVINFHRDEEKDVCVKMQPEKVTNGVGKVTRIT